MTTFKEIAGDDLDVFFNIDEFAETVTYNGVAIAAVPGNRSGKTPGAVTRVETIQVMKSDVPNPAYQDNVVKNATNWLVGPRDEDFEEDDNTWTLPIYANRRPVL